MPRYDEIDFYDKFPARERDTSPQRKQAKISAGDNREARYMYQDILNYGDLADSISLKNINYSFTPKQMRGSKTSLTVDDLNKMIIDILEARTKKELDMKVRQQGKGLMDETYFNFSKFIEAYFKKIQPQQLARDKLVFNFLWSIHHSNNNVLVEVIIDLITGRLVLRDLLNLLMVKDFVKHYLKKTAQLNFVDLASVGLSY